MEEIDKDIEDRMFQVYKQISAAKMRELSPGEMRLLYKQAMVKKMAPLAGMPMDQSGNLPGGMLS